MGLRVLVIDDSLVFQKIIKSVLEECEGVGEVLVAGNGAEGLAHVGSSEPDLVLLDLNLPDLDGMEVLRSARLARPRLQVAVISGMTTAGADLTVQALSLGAQHFFPKPAGAGFQQSVDTLKGHLAPLVRMVGRQKRGSRGFTGQTPAPDSIAPPPRIPRSAGAPASGFWIIAVAVSTGGPEALAKFVTRLPAQLAVPVVLVQHMPPLFTQSLARSLDAKSAVTVVEAGEGDLLQPGRVYIAPGGKHTVVRKTTAGPVLSLNEDPPEQSVRPAADVLFRSLSRFPNPGNVLAVVMTGMGQDGLAGVQALKRSGCRCLTQTEETCVVYGMPKAIVDAGLSDEQLPVEELAGRVAFLAGVDHPAPQV